MAVADDERRSDLSAQRHAHRAGAAGPWGDIDAAEQAERPHIDRIADKVEGLLRSRD